MAGNQYPNPNDPPVIIISDDEEPVPNLLFDEDWLKDDPLDLFYHAPKPEIPPEFGSSSFDSINIDNLFEDVRPDTFDEVGTVGLGGAVGPVGAVSPVGPVGAVGTVGSVFAGAGIGHPKEKERERERMEEIQKWKKEMSRARNQLAERRRTRKLSENIIKLRAAVPKISNMDRISTLSDAIHYIQELKKMIQDLQNEIDPGASSSSSINQPPEPNSIPQFEYLGSQSAFVDVRIFENGKIYIHMFCKPNPTIMPSVIRALELLNLDIESAYFGSLTSFVLDVFCSKQPDDKPEWKHEDIRSLLLACIGEGNEKNNLKF